MTRGTFYLILKDGTIYQSTEFNGDMYLEGYGKDAYYFLEDFKNSGNITKEGFKDLIKMFNAEHHRYDDIDEDRWVYDRCMNNNLKELIATRCSDYSYVLDMNENKVRVFYFDKEIPYSNIINGMAMKSI